MCFRRILSKIAEFRKGYHAPLERSARTTYGTCTRVEEPLRVKDDYCLAEAFFYGRITPKDRSHTFQA